MTEDEFKQFLTTENLTLIKFSEITNTPLATVQKWGKSSKVPSWIPSFINYYYKAQELEELKNALKTINRITSK